MDVIKFERLQDETEEELIYRICSQKDIIGTWSDVAVVINKLTGNDFGESTYRKKFQSFQKMLNANQSKFSESSEQLKEIELQKRELEREKIKFRDERNAWQKQNYIDARVEQKLDLLEEQLLSQGKVNFEKHGDVNISSNNDILVILSDFHIGQTFSSPWGNYNSDIAKGRLSQLLSEIIEIRQLYNSENCFISLQGDMLSGNIHKTIQVTNRENVIQQIKIASELISSFCYELSKHFAEVYMSSVVGNHSRIDKKEEALHDERLDDLITWGVNLSLKHIVNFHILNNNFDNGISSMEIRGKDYINVHGDMDAYSKNGVSNLCMYLGYIPYAITYGHLHTCAVDETNGIKMIRGGSLAGSGDSYTIEKRLSGKASQMVCVCNKDGVVCYYPIELN